MCGCECVCEEKGQNEIYFACIDASSIHQFNVLMVRIIEMNTAKRANSFDVSVCNASSRKLYPVESTPVHIPTGWLLAGVVCMLRRIAYYIHNSISVSTRFQFHA